MELIRKRKRGIKMDNNRTNENNTMITDIKKFRSNTEKYDSFHEYVSYVMDHMQPGIVVLIENLVEKLDFINLKDDETFQETIDELYLNNPRDTEMGLTAFRLYSLIGIWMYMKDKMDKGKIAAKINNLSKLAAEKNEDIKELKQRELKDIKICNVYFDELFDKVKQAYGDMQTEAYTFFKQSKVIREVMMMTAREMMLR